MKRALDFLLKHLLPISIILWGIEVLFLAYWLGIKQGSDSFFFITLAQKASFGDAYVDQHYTWYKSYTLFISLFYKTGIGLRGVVAAQVLIASSTLFAVYDLCKKLTYDDLSPKIAVFLYVIWVKSHIWHFYIYSDSLFTSCCIWCICGLCTFKSWPAKVLWGFVILFTSFIRPVGVVLFMLYILALLVPFKRRPWLYWGLTCLAIFSLFFFVSTSMMPTFELLDSYKKGEIIYSYPPWNIPSALLSLPRSPENSISNLAFFIFHNPVYFLKLSTVKAIAFLVNAKPFYAWYHNALIVFILFPAYSLFLLGLKQWKNENVKQVLLYWILGNVLIVAFSAEDWDGRFLLPILPFVWIGASIALSNLMRQ